MTYEQMFDLLQSCAKGRYQENLVVGREAWSGATLRGKAKIWSCKYSLSRSNLIGRLARTAKNYGWEAFPALMLMDSRWHTQLVLVNPEKEWMDLTTGKPFPEFWLVTKTASDGHGGIHQRIHAFGSEKAARQMVLRAWGKRAPKRWTAVLEKHGRKGREFVLEEAMPKTAMLRLAEGVMGNETGGISWPEP